MARARSQWNLLILWLVLSAVYVQCLDAEDTGSTDEEYEEPVERAFLIVRKKIFEPDVILGKNMTVVVSIYNAGNRHAAVLS